VHLVVPVGHGAAGIHQHGAVPEPAGAGILDRADQHRRVELPGQLTHHVGPRVALEVAFRVDHVLRPHHQVDRLVDEGGGVDVALEHLDDPRVRLAGALLAAPLDERHRGGADVMPARCDGGAEHEEQRRQPQARGRPPGGAGGGGGRLTDEHGEQQEQQAAAHPEHGRQRTGDLPDGEVGQGHPAERPRPAHELGQRPRAGQREPATPAGWRRRHAGAEHRGVEDAGDDVPRRRQRGHPAQRRHEAAHRHEPSAPEPSAHRLVGDHPIEPDEADGGEGPEPERWERQAQSGAAGEARGARAEALGSGRHRGMMAATRSRAATR
jgi:hypothetical protein